MRGEKNEGYHICGIYQRREDAESRALREQVLFGDGSFWELDPYSTPKDTVWRKGVDYISIGAFDLM
jgi:phage baseplate assembly protein gpV